MYGQFTEHLPKTTNYAKNTETSKFRQFPCMFRNVRLVVADLENMDSVNVLYYLGNYREIQEKHTQAASAYHNTHRDASDNTRSCLIRQCTTLHLTSMIVVLLGS